ncbi:BLUF domain-containing protein [Aequorivita sp. SDUM287046]|uniref:BLUF domain-containing protein n=1 Tax=Aequorivita aurantiaca TaxID=3053356 RepID=A0ABT8DIA6_9FLAO|nr:BLUF domain-containing protein [Aequorivita aurantiaca]MDN3724514.1 BLUF domain-containing protein [Aequorivita aurantiaca]
MEHTICYLSKQAGPLQDSELEALFNFILGKNLTLNITGALLSTNDFFLQILEGKKDTIDEIFSKIRKDKRHRNILTILNQKIENRIFNTYEANFSILKTKEDIVKLNTYLSKYDVENRYPKNIKSLIEPFLL